MWYVTVKLCMPNHYAPQQGKRRKEEKRWKIPQGGLFFPSVWRNSSGYDEVTWMPFCELHPLNYTILHYTKGDLFSMLYGSYSIHCGSFLDIQTLSPKVSLVIIRIKKEMASYSTKDKMSRSIQCLFFFFFFLNLFQNYACFHEAEVALVFGKKSLPTRVHVWLIYI